MFICFNLIGDTIQSGQLTCYLSNGSFISAYITKQDNKKENFTLANIQEIFVNKNTHTHKI